MTIRPAFRADPGVDDELWDIDASVLSVRETPSRRIVGFEAKVTNQIRLRSSIGNVVFLYNAGMISGRVAVTIGGEKRSCTLIPGAAIVVERREQVDVTFDKPLDLLGVFLSDAYVERLFPEAKEDLALNLQTLTGQALNAPLISASAQAVWDGLGDDKAHAKLIVEGGSTSLIGAALREAERRKGANDSGLGTEQVQSIMQFIEANADRKISSRQMAELVGLGGADFQKYFKGSFGKPPKQFVMEFRLKKACSMIKGSDESFACIAAECGFCDQSHLTNMLRKHLGQTPGSIRFPRQHGVTSDMVSTEKRTLTSLKLVDGDPMSLRPSTAP